MTGKPRLSFFNPRELSHRSIIDPMSGQPDESMLDPSWLQSRPKDELVGYILQLARELKLSPRGETTLDVKVDLESRVVTGGAWPEVLNYVRLPADSQKHVRAQAATTWRLILARLDGQIAPFGIEIFDDVLVGRAVEGIYPHLDLTVMGGEELGVSRLHALLRPTHDRLLLFDLDSSNGTFCNRQQCAGTIPLEVQDNDVIRFGALAFRVQITKQPTKGN